jgi:pimeloyl-ACP methyl ester carboxylesterase
VSFGLHVERVGQGPPVVLVHGSVAAGASAWSAQRELAERWTLLVVDRPGFGAAAGVDRVDFEADAPLVAEALGDGAHLVGQSYGGLISLLAAARRPRAVRSLAVIEPPAFAVARGHPAVEEFVSSATRLWGHGPSEPEAFLRTFLELVGSGMQPPSPLPPSLERGARMLMVERYPWEAVVPLDELARAPFPKLVVSGGHHAAFDAVCDVLEERLGAERAVITGAGHSVQRTGAPCNERLERFLCSAEDGVASPENGLRGGSA